MSTVTLDPDLFDPDVWEAEFLAGGAVRSLDEEAITESVPELIRPAKIENVLGYREYFVLWE